MRKTGVVKKIEKNKITVAVYKEDACAHCSKCSDKAKTINEYILYNNDNKKIEVGDFLTFEMETKVALAIGLLVYIVPLIVMIISYFLGERVFSNDKISILLSFIGLSISFIFIFFYDRIVMKKKISKYINIISIEAKGDLC